MNKTWQKHEQTHQAVDYTNKARQETMALAT